jgi:multidrug efflux pump subunit AcrA (membrane-fusion protein)
LITKFLNFSLSSARSIGSADVDPNSADDRLMAEFFGWRLQQVQEAVVSRGSGVVIDEEGYVLTNVHVVDGVKRVFVKVGDSVKEGAPLFQLDEREVRARVRVLEAQARSLRSQIAVEEAQVADLADQLKRFAQLGRDQVATEDEVKRREFSLGTARARADAVRAAATASEESVRQANTDLEILTVRAPRDGRLLQVNLREGEYASVKSSSEPLMLLGDVDTYQVRAEVDEQDSVLISADYPAVASLKGHSEMKMPLKFVRIEPYVVPKRSLTGDSLERVDTRVLQIVYAFDRPAFPVYVGQQVDVFIQRPQTEPAKKL